MKKRLFAILLALTLALSLLPTAVFATGEDGAAEVKAAQPADEEQPGSGAPDAEKPEEPAVQSAGQGIAVQAAHTHCFCGGSVTAGDHNDHSQSITYKACKTWRDLESPWVGKDSIAYVYLENDITAENVDKLYPYLSIQQGRTLYLCLNGHKLDLGDNYIWVGQNGATLYLCDCSVQKTGTVSGGSRGCVSVDDNIACKATFNMYGGTLRDGNRTTGGGVDVTNGTMNMYGGTITENTATSDGGGIFVNTTSTLNLYGGTITKNTVSTNEDHHGGGVYVESNFETGAGKISISGSPVITGNTRTYTPDSTTTTENLYLSYGFYNSGKFPTITLGTLTSGANIGISTKKATAFSTASETDYSEYFSSDDTGCHVEYNADKKLELKSGAAHVHSGGIATCTAKAKCSTCNAEYGEKNPDNHTGTLGSWQSDDNNHWKVYTCCKAIISKAAHHGDTATCTTRALCMVCGTRYGNIDPNNHTWLAWTSNGNGTHTRVCWNSNSHKETVSCSGGTATCTEKAVCETCGGEYGDLASHNFTAETVDGKYLKSAADCENAAVYYKSCTGCGLSSKGTASEATFTSGSTLDHDWGEPSYTWAAVPDGYMCAAYRKCNHCSEDVSEVATVTYAVTTAPTCLNDGIGTYTATFSAAFGFPAQAKNVTLSALGHKWGDVTYTWTENAAGGYDCTAKRICENDSNHIETDNAAVTYSVVTPAACETAGSGTYTATFTAAWAAAQTKDAAIPAAGHDWADATCTAPKTCKVCQVTEGSALGHDWADATCTTPKTCKVCEVTEGSALGHDWADATCTTPKTCKVCEVTEGNALGHDWDSATCTTPKTCKVCKVTEGDALGHKGGTATCHAKAVCEVCKQEYGEVDADNHDGGTEIKDAKDASCTEKGYTGDTYCKGCGAKLTDGKDIPATGHTGGTADCCHKAKCEVCKQEYGEFDPDNHSDLKHIPYKRATTRTEGNIEYWYCSGCGKYYKDAEATKEITQKDTVVRKRRSTFGSSADDDKTVKSVKTGDAGIALYVGMAALSLTGGAWLRRKTK